MAVQEMVRILRTFVQGDEETLREAYGPEAVAIAHDMERVLEERLQAESAYASLWDQFEEKPEDTNTKLMGALEAMIEADPGLAQRLNAFVEEFHRAVAPPGAEMANLRADETTATDVVPDTTVTSGEKYGKGSGTYLYGNVKGGAEPLSEDVGTGEVDLGDGARLRRESLVVNVSVEFFGELHDAVDNYPRAEASDKEILHRALRKIQGTLMEESVPDLNTGILRNKIQIVQDLAPEIAKDLRRRLNRLVQGEQYTET